MKEKGDAVASETHGKKRKERKQMEGSFLCFSQTQGYQIMFEGWSKRSAGGKQIYNVTRRGLNDETRLEEVKTTDKCKIQLPKKFRFP